MTMHTTPRILVVDDSAMNVALLVRFLGKAGYEVITAADGFAAVDQAIAERPDLILLDMMMPGRDGLETCRILASKEATATIPVIFVTGASDPEKVVEAFAAGGCDYVTKPFHIQEVLARVSVHLRLREAEKALNERNAQLEALARQLAEANTDLAHQTRIDPLTSLLNRGAWEESARLEHERTQRYGGVYSILMIDADHFKAMNDSQGHAAGDECLRRMARSFASMCRATDLVGRYGGEEFVILAPETPLEAGCKLGERLRQGVWDLRVPHAAGPAGRLTISIGVAGSESDALEEVVKRADAALYQAKTGGRNLVFAFGAAISAKGTPSHPGAIATPASPTPSTSEDLPTVLVVDDNPTSRKLCTGCLIREGYRIREAANGREALNEVQLNLPDVILMDIMMPEMDGLECIRRLRADPQTRDVPIIVVSALTETSEVVAGLEAGADEYLTKPVKTTELTVRVRSMAHLRRERKDLLHSYHLRSEQIRLLTVLLEYCRVLSTSATAHECLDHTVAVVAELTTSRRVSIMLPDATRQYLAIAQSIGMDERPAAAVRVPIGAGVSGKVFATRRPVVLNTEQDGQRPREGYDSQFFASVPLLSAPLQTSGQIVGVLNVSERVGGRPFETQELEYVELIAGIAGAALHSHLTRRARDEARDMIMVALARLAEHRDNDTARHVERVTRYSLVLAEELRGHEPFRNQIDDEFLHGLERTVPLHDIGKVAIPDAILRKPGKLTAGEMAIMRTHAEIGADTLRPILDKTPGIKFLEMAVEIIHAHHEWYDGSGYPRGLRGVAIPLSARIVALADVYDALTTRRVYKEAMTHEEAAAVIGDHAGTQFDPVVVEAFRRRQADFKRLMTELADTPPRSLG